MNYIIGDDINDKKHGKNAFRGYQDHSYLFSKRIFGYGLCWGHFNRNFRQLNSYRIYQVRI